MSYLIDREYVTVVETCERFSVSRGMIKETELDFQLLQKEFEMLQDSSVSVSDRAGGTRAPVSTSSFSRTIFL